MWTYYIFPTRIRYEKVDLCFTVKSQGTDSVVCGRLRKYGVHTSNNQMEVPLCTRHPILIWLSMMAHTSTCLPPTQHNTHLVSFNTYNFLWLDSKEDESFWVVEHPPSLGEPPTTHNNLPWYPSPALNIRNSTQALKEEWECGPNS